MSIIIYFSLIKPLRSLKAFFALNAHRLVKYAPPTTTAKYSNNQNCRWIEILIGNISYFLLSIKCLRFGLFVTSLWTFIKWVRWLVGCSVCRNFLKGRKLHFHALLEHLLKYTLNSISRGFGSGFFLAAAAPLTAGSACAAAWLLAINPLST